MLTVLVIVKALIAVAGLTLVGQGILYVLAGAGRETNVFYRLLRTIVSPAIGLVRRFTPRKLVPDAYIGFATFFLLAGIYLAILLEQRDLCLADLQQPACERLVVDYQQRCASGQLEACEILKQGAAKRSGATGNNQ